MRREGRSVALVLAAGVAVALAGCGSSSSHSAAADVSATTGGSGASGTKSPAKILAIVDTTGPTKAFGAQELTGIKAAAAYYNAKGGVAGHQLVVQAVTDNGDPATAASAAIKALSSDPSQYTMVYAGEEGTTVAALVPVLKRFPVYAVALDDPGEVCAKAASCPHEFANLGSGALAEVQAAKWFKSKGYKDVGVLADQTPFTQTETGPIQNALTQQGIKHTTVSFPATAVTLTSEMSQLKSAGVTAVFAEALGPAAGYVLKARAALGWNVPVVFDIAGSALDLTMLAPKADVANSYTTVCPCQDPSKASPGLQQLEKYAPPGAIGPLPANLAGDGWDAVVLFSHALSQANSTSAAALTKATENLSPSAQTDPLYMVTNKKLFSASNHQNMGEAPADYTILAAGPVKNGQTQPLK